jgi:hypothetical protein
MDMDKLVDISKEILELKLKDRQTQESKLKIQKLQQELDFLRSKSNEEREEIPDLGYMDWLDFKENGESAE